MAEPFAHIVATLIDERKRRGWSQRDVARLAGFAQSDLSHYERGLRPLGFGRLSKWAAVFGLELEVTLVRREDR